MTRRCELITWENLRKRSGCETDGPYVPSPLLDELKGLLQVQHPTDQVIIDTDMHGDLGRGSWCVYRKAGDADGVEPVRGHGLMVFLPESEETDGVVFVTDVLRKGRCM